MTYSLVNLWHAEPARIVAAIMAVLAVAIAFGLPVTEDQTSRIETAISAVLVILAGGETIRANVYSPATVDRLRSGDDPSR